MSDETMITGAEARALREAATPGPWGVVRESGTTNDPDAAHPDWHHTVRHVGGGETGHNAPWVADVAGACGNGWSEPGADAALIAAAPALALALEAAERSECILAATLADVERARQAERQRADELEAALKASKERVGDARIMAGLILSAYDPATPADRAAPTAAAAIERAHRFLLDTKPAAISPEEGG